jgi:hypothetical protein
MDLKKIRYGGVDSSQLSQDRLHVREFVSDGFQKVVNLLTTWAAISLSRWSFLRGIDILIDFNCY